MTSEDLISLILLVLIFYRYSQGFKFVDVVPLRQEVIYPYLFSLFPSRQINNTDPGIPPTEVFGQSRSSFAHRGIIPVVGVKADMALPILEGDVVKIGQYGSPAQRVPSLEIPYSGQGDGAFSTAGQ